MLCLEEDLPTDATNESIHHGFMSTEGLEVLAWLRNTFEIRKSIYGKVYPNKPGYFQFYPHLSFDDMVGILESRERRRGEVAVAFRDANCSGRQIRPEKFNVQTRTWRMLWHMNDQLRRGNIVGIAYKPSFMVKNPAVLGSASKGHGSTVVKVRQRDGVTQYLIRQSWSLSMTYSDQVEPDSDMQGHLWVNSQDLEPNLFEVIYIEDESQGQQAFSDHSF